MIVAGAPLFAGPAQSVAFADWLSQAAGAQATVVGAEQLSGGAIQQNWALDVLLDGAPHAFVLRTDAPSSLPMSHSRAREFTLLQVAAAAGVTVATPRFASEDPAFTGAPFFIMDRVRGVGLPSHVLRDPALGGDRERLGESLGAELARIHAIRPPHASLHFLTPPARSPALDAVDAGRTVLDDLGLARPTLEWGLRWLERNAPRATELVLCHRDFRTGNYLVDERGVTAILDWEFAGWSDPAEDIGWFCAACWRFGNDRLEAGGIATRGAFYRGYERVAGTAIDADAVTYWEVAAHVRWAVIGLCQAARHLSGAERSLELALTAHLVPELEYEILGLTGGWR